MGDAWWWVMDIVGPLILLVLLVWLAFWAWRRQSPRDTERAERGTERLYDEEERRHRAGTDDL
jgi:uncharacterized membrane protein